MRARPGTTRTLRALALAAALGLFLGGCAGEPEPGSTAGPAAATPSTDRSSSPSPAAQESPAPPTTTPEAEESPSLPPGDPGLDAPSVPDPGTTGAEPHGHAKVRRTVPETAMLSAADMSMMLGGAWERRAGGGDECVVPARTVARRSMSYGGTSAGVVVETVASYADVESADAAVAELGRTAAACGWSDVRDPRLGSASVAADEGARTLTAVSAEGVVVLLVGTGDVSGDAMRWGSVVDIALGSSCPAAPDGCH